MRLQLQVTVAERSACRFQDRTGFANTSLIACQNTCGEGVASTAVNLRPSVEVPMQREEMRMAMLKCKSKADSI